MDGLVLRPSPPVVAPVEAGIVGGTVDPDPVGLIDPAPIERCWARREGGGDLDPPSLLARDRPDLLGNLRQVLILAQYERYVVVATECHPDDVKSHADVDTFLLRSLKGVGRAVRQVNGLVPVAEWAREDVDPLSTHDPQLA